MSFAKQTTGKILKDELITLAKDTALNPRVIARDGQNFSTTMEFRPDRLNFVVDNGTIVRAYCG